jgi:hypothetical protein
MLAGCDGTPAPPYTLFAAPRAPSAIVRCDALLRR